MGTVTVIDTVIQLYRFIPVKLRRKGREAVVARRFCRKLHVSIISVTKVDARSKELMRYVIEIIVALKESILVVAHTEIHNLGWLSVRNILSRHMIGNEVNDHAHTGIMSAHQQRLKLPYSIVHIHSYVRIHIVVVLYRIGRSGFAFDYVWIISTYSIARIVGLIGVFDNPCIPHMRDSQILNAS